MKPLRVIIKVLAAALSILVCLCGCAAAEQPSPSPQMTASPDVVMETASPAPSQSPDVGGDGTQYDWRIVGEGSDVFEVPGMPGTATMIIALDLHKAGGATPAGTYTGSFYIWYNEMTPELMEQYGITGDSFNEYKSDNFTVEIHAKAGDRDWPYRTDGQERMNIVITSVTDVVIAGHSQQVTDYPDMTIKCAVDINPDTGAVRFTLTIGQKSHTYEGLLLEKSDR